MMMTMTNFQGIELLRKLYLWYSIKIFISFF